MIWTFIEVVAVVCNLAFTYWAAHYRWQAWLWGIFSALLTGIICLNALLYSETLLQLIYFIYSTYCLITWNTLHKKELLSQPQIVGWPIHFVWVGIGIIVSLGMGRFWADKGAALTYLDSLTTVFSLIALWMMGRRWLASWIYWIGIDLVSIYLYYSRGLYLFTLLYALYTILAVYGYISWKKRI